MTTVDADPIGPAEPYAFAVEVAESWLDSLPPLGTTAEAWRFEITAAVKPVLESASATAAEVRAVLLAQAERIIAAYGEAGWLLDGAPRFEFDGSLRHARVDALTGVVFEMPAEYGIGLTLRLSLLRAVKVKAPKRPGW